MIRQIHVTGVVQGVGFRPFVFQLATRANLMGWVVNTSAGVGIEIEGDELVLDAFVRALTAEKPPLARIDSLQVRDAPSDDHVPFDRFEIRESIAVAGAFQPISPDISICPDCLRELFDPQDRRYRYPFINCTNCGPRFTIIGDVPYDRPMTSMRDFPMCPECAAEYGDPADRRFHAQPDACFICGPRLYLNAAVELAGAGGPLLRQTSAPTAPAQLASDPPPQPARNFKCEPDWLWTPELEVSPRPHRERGAEAARGDEIIATAAGLLLGGRVLAIKGLGGFHLACDATNPEAVARLRSRKRRWGKPLAVMVPNLEAARRIAHVGPEEEALLAGVVRPIVLLRRKPEDGLAPAIADNLTELGVMLPYTPLHRLLLDAVEGRSLVMTSGNLSDEPIATDNLEALDRLGTIADAFLDRKSVV
jgi:hydrogenase maturation protein HypF